MDELEKQLRSILDSPGELQRLAQMAQGLLGGGEPAGEHSSPLRAGDRPGEGAEAGEHSSPLRAGDRPAGGGADPAAGLAALKNLFSAGNAGGKRALVDALAPYLGEKRRGKLYRAASLASAARLAEKLLGEQGGPTP